MKTEKTAEMHCSEKFQALTDHEEIVHIFEICLRINIQSKGTQNFLKNLCILIFGLPKMKTVTTTKPKVLTFKNILRLGMKTFHFFNGSGVVYHSFSKLLRQKCRVL